MQVVVVDVVLLAAMGVSVAVSSMRGLVRELLGLMAWGVGALAFLVFLAPLAKHIASWGVQSPAHWLCAGVVIMLGIWLAVRGIAFLMHAVFRGLGMSWLDHFLGGCFGLLRGCIIVYLAVWGLKLVLGPDHPWMTQAYVPGYIYEWTDQASEGREQLSKITWDSLRSLDLSWLSTVLSKEDIAAIRGFDLKGASGL